MQPALVIGLGSFASLALEKMLPHLQTTYIKFPPMVTLSLDERSVPVGETYRIVDHISHNHADLQPYLFDNPHNRRLQHRMQFLRHLLTSKQQFATFIQRNAEQAIGSRNVPFDVYLFASLGDLAVSGVLCDVLNAITWALEAHHRQFRLLVHLALPEATDERVTPEISGAAFACLRELEDMQLSYTPLYPADSALAECNIPHVPFSNLLIFSKSVGNPQNLLASWAALIMVYLDDQFGNALKQVWNNVPNAVTRAQRTYQSLIVSAPLLRMAWLPLSQLQRSWAHQLLQETLQRLQQSVQIEVEFQNWTHGGRGYRGVRDELVYAPQLIDQLRNFPLTPQIPNDLTKQLFSILCAYGDPTGQYIHQLTSAPSVQTMLTWQPDLRNFSTSKGLFESVEQHLDAYFGSGEAANGGNYGQLLRQAIEGQTIRVRLALLAWIKHLLNGRVYPMDALAGLERVETVFKAAQERFDHWEQTQLSFSEKRAQLINAQRGMGNQISVTAATSYLTQVKNTVQLGFLRASLRSALNLCEQCLQMIRTLKQTLQLWRYALPTFSAHVHDLPVLAPNVYPLYDVAWAKQIYHQYLKPLGTQLDTALQWKLAINGPEFEVTLTLDQEPLPVHYPREVERLLLAKANHLADSAIKKLTLWDYLIPNQRIQLPAILEHLRHPEDPLPGGYPADQIQQQHFMLVPIHDAPSPTQSEILSALQQLATDRLIGNGESVEISAQTHLIMFSRRDVLPWRLTNAYRDLAAIYRQFRDRSVLYVLPRSGIAAKAESQLEQLKLVTDAFRLDPAITVLYNARSRLDKLVWVAVLNWWGRVSVASQSFRWQLRAEGMPAWWIGEEALDPTLFTAAKALCFDSQFEQVDRVKYGEFRDLKIAEAVQAYFERWYRSCPSDFLSQVSNQQWWGRAKSLERTRQRQWGFISAQQCQLLYDYFYAVFSQPDPEPL
ncbi:MAG: hypothetical protein MUF87_12660, partial [Anaerolineae bacterium]|nr:hypothetical protein [Anaerolineae bacterium]